MEIAMFVVLGAFGTWAVVFHMLKNDEVLDILDDHIHGDIEPVEYPD